MDAPADSPAVVRWWAPPAWAARASLVSAFAMLGVLSRLYLGQAFLSANVTGTFSALFIDLPANVAGSFLLGVASSGAVVGHGRVASPPPAGAAAEYAWGILPQGSAVNRLGALVDVNVGFRTGYCGSFTTFASWNLQMVQLMTRAIGYLWLTSIVGYLVGFHFAIGSFALGTVVARCVNDWLTARAAGRAAADGAQTETELVGGSAKLGGRAAEDGPAPPSDLDPDPERAGGDGLERRDASVRLFIFAVSVAANACLFTLFALLYAFQVGDSVWSQPRTWLAVILGPPGALLRWQLARLNGGAVLRRGRWAAFPLGTFIANVAAAAVDTALGGVLVSRGSSMSSRAYDGVIAVLAGAMGSLSTTSTFVGEVAGLLRRRGMEGVGVLYAVSTILVALVVGVATYGWAEWTTGSDIIL